MTAIGMREWHVLQRNEGNWHSLQRMKTVFKNGFDGITTFLGRDPIGSRPSLETALPGCWLLIRRSLIQVQVVESSK
jgi:hypothetical protein